MREHKRERKSSGGTTTITTKERKRLSYLHSNIQMNYKRGHHIGNHIESNANNFGGIT